jgi:predicted chitinase
MIKYEKLLNNEEKKANFADIFLKKYLEYGFTTLNKGDLQDLILYSMNESSEIDFLNENTNYEISNFLKTTEAKVKSSILK